MRRNRIANSFHEYAFLKQKSSEFLVERIKNIKKQFDVVLDLGAHCGQLGNMLQDMANIGEVISCDISEAMVKKIDRQQELVCDEEFLPFKMESFDLVVSSFSLHWINDFPGVLQQIKYSLKEDGMLIANIVGGNSLANLRRVLMHLAAKTNVACPRVSPFIDVKTLGLLMHRAGFIMPVTDSETIIIRYDNIKDLWVDLHNMAEMNALVKRSNIIIGKQFLDDLDREYKKLVISKDNAIEVNFDIVSMTGLAR